MLPIVYADVADLGRMVPCDAPHQGIVAEVEPLEEIWLGDLLQQGRDDRRPLLVLDQVTDPHNVGAILRSAAAFDALGIVTQDRHAPPESGDGRAGGVAVRWKSVPWVRVVNLARALEEIAEAGFWRIGLTGRCRRRRFAQAIGQQRIALVLGAEGEGMRQNTETHCDELAKLPISPKVESLNVSNAAAIALYAVAARAQANPLRRSSPATRPAPSVNGIWHDSREVSSRSEVEFEQIVLVLAHLRQLADEFRVDMHMAGRAASSSRRTAPATRRSRRRGSAPSPTAPPRLRSRVLPLRASRR